MAKVRGFAPATIANVGPCFDVVGVAINEPGDEVEVELTSEFRGVKLVEIVNNPGLPLGPYNVVEAVGQKLWDSIKPYKGKPYGAKVTLYKNMKIGTGMGSSASSESAVAIALLELLGYPIDKHSKPVLEALVYGEQVATGSPHPDNVLPSFFGSALVIYDGLNFTRYEGQHNYHHPSIYFAVVSPDLRLDTREMRKVLPKTTTLVETTRNLLKERSAPKGCKIDLGIDYSEQIKAIATEMKISEENARRYLIGSLKVMYGLKYDIPKMLGDGVLQDGIITPIRAKYIRSYDRVKDSALHEGAYGVSISGSGPSMFAVAPSLDSAHRIGDVMIKAWERKGVRAVIYASPINNQGARLV